MIETLQLSFCRNPGFIWLLCGCQRLQGALVRGVPDWQAAWPGWARLAREGEGYKLFLLKIVNMNSLKHIQKWRDCYNELPSPCFNNFQLMVNHVYLFIFPLEIFWCKTPILYILICKFQYVYLKIITTPLLYLQNENNLIASTGHLVFKFSQLSHI